LKRLLLLSTIICGPGFGAVIGTCVPSTLSTLVVGDPCARGDESFSNFAYTGNADASNILVDHSEFRLIPEPITGAGFFTNFTFTSTVTVSPGVARGAAGMFDVANSSGPTVDSTPGQESDGAADFALAASVSTKSTLVGPGGTGDASPGLSSFELGDTVVPEPATFGLVGIALVCAGLFRKRIAQF
jgi:hypothetical protein